MSSNAVPASWATSTSTDKSQVAQDPRLDSSPRSLDRTKRFVVGVAIFKTLHDQPASSRHQVLMLRRSASEDAFPNAWEIPGGHVEDDDESIRHAVARETLEETGQVVEDLLGEIEEMRWESKGRTNVQLNYIVSIKGGKPVVLNPEEHSAWQWVDLSTVDELYMTPEMRVVVGNALSFAATHLSP